MCVEMCIYIFVHTFCGHGCIHCVYDYIYLCVHSYIYIYIHIYIYMYICMRITDIYMLCFFIRHARMHSYTYVSPTNVICFWYMRSKSVKEFEEAIFTMRRCVVRICLYLRIFMLRVYVFYQMQ